MTGLQLYKLDNNNLFNVMETDKRMKKILKVITGFTKKNITEFFTCVSVNSKQIFDEYKYTTEDNFKEFVVEILKMIEEEEFRLFRSSVYSVEEQQKIFEILSDRNVANNSLEMIVKKYTEQALDTYKNLPKHLQEEVFKVYTFKYLFLKKVSGCYDEGDRI